MGKKKEIAEQIKVIEAALEVIKDLIDKDDEQQTENTVPPGGGGGTPPGGGTGGG